jgi:glucose-1-phosphate adenylyltransferase
VRDSILFSKVMVGARCEIESSLLLPDVRCGSDVRLRRTIVDKRCRLPDGFVAGFDARDDAARGLHRTPGGVTVVSPGMLGQAGRGG